ncbi:alpha/beta hydrolase [Gordonia sp. TBRC 11910]|uniref:Alpha/beta hydrolase n=1 Tax=Gordonia asplenii TaxID=2725283 RepID=A0A848KVW3_9ACTN|nr:alpha/beta hydrolase [Gordonia asplenii]NMO02392.1 alpha/beta hydrolase [Gordonia asplenii]
MGFLRRRIITALLTANALEPMGGYTGRLGSVYGWSTQGMLGFAVGWPTGELAPQLLALTAADTARAVVRGEASKTSLALAAGTVAGLGYLTAVAAGTGKRAEESLVSSLGEDYRHALPDGLGRENVSLAQLIRPFRSIGRNVEVIRNINYRPGDGLTKLDIYRRKGMPVDAAAPVLFQVHGGAWTIGDKFMESKVLINRMVQRGWVVVAVNYRLAPKNPFPAQIIDVKEALTWVKANIAGYGGDSTYIAGTGGSAGGHLIALTALTPGDPEFQPGFEGADTSLDACVPVYGLHDMAGVTGDELTLAHRDTFLGPHVLMRDPATEPEPFELASPLLRVTADAPDFFVVHGGKDHIVDVTQGRAFADKLRQVSQGVVTYLEPPLADHGFDTFNSVRSVQVVSAIERWLEWHRATRRNVAATEATTPAEATTVEANVAPRSVIVGASASR